MNKLLAISILLLIGCSPASPDESEITIGRPEKGANSFPIPLGIWKRTDEATLITRGRATFDFTDVEYDGKISDVEIERLVNKIMEKKAEENLWEYRTVFVKRYWDERKREISTKGFWYETDNGKIIVNYRMIEWPDEPLYRLELTVDRGQLLNTKDGNRWKRQED